jgi:hypothetical protein
LSLSTKALLRTPLCAMALEKRPAEAGDMRWAYTLIPPALSPKMVT